MMTLACAGIRSSYHEKSMMRPPTKTKTPARWPGLCCLISLVLRLTRQPCASVATSRASH